MTLDTLMVVAIWISAYAGVLGLIAFASGQIMRQEARKIFMKQRVDQLRENRDIAQHCFGGGEVLKSGGQAKYMCPKCPYILGCINVSERLRKGA